MRIGIASLNHESNTFASFTTALSDFHVGRGPEIVARYRSTFHEVGGFIAGADEFGYEIAPLLSAEATPSGTVQAKAYAALVDELLDRIEGARQLDGLLLALHGAMVAEEFPHADGETVRRVRALVGAEFPLFVTHDYHGNVPPQLVEDATALVIYKTCPHVDQRERGLQAAALLTRTVRGEAKPEAAIVKPELLYNIAFHNTGRGPMKRVMEAAIELERQPGILAANVAAGYQYADVPWMGPSVVVVSDGDRALAEREAQRLADLMWSTRDELLPRVAGATEAVRMAIASKETPVSLFEMGDNIGGGSAGDATIILDELLRQGADGWVVALYDPEAAAACRAGGHRGAGESAGGRQGGRSARTDVDGYRHGARAARRQVHRDRTPPRRQAGLGPGADRSAGDRRGAAVAGQLAHAADEPEPAAFGGHHAGAAAHLRGQGSGCAARRVRAGLRAHHRGRHSRRDVDQPPAGGLSAGAEGTVRVVAARRAVGEGAGAATGSPMRLATILAEETTPGTPTPGCVPAPTM